MTFQEQQYQGRNDGEKERGYKKKEKKVGGIWRIWVRQRKTAGSQCKLERVNIYSPNLIIPPFAWACDQMPD